MIEIVLFHVAFLPSEKNASPVPVRWKQGDPGGVEENSRPVAASEIRATPEGSKRIAGGSRRAR
jgi:hypothetical protein